MCSVVTVAMDELGLETDERRKKKRREKWSSCDLSTKTAAAAVGRFAC